MISRYKSLRDYYVVPIVQSYPNIDRPHMLQIMSESFLFLIKLEISLRIFRKIFTH